MSQSAFSLLFKNPAFKKWYSKEITAKDPDTTSIIGIGRQDAKNFVRRTAGDFILSEEQLSEIFSPQVADKLLRAAASEDIELTEIVQFRNADGQRQLIFPEIKFGNANNQIKRFLSIIGDKAGITGTSIPDTIDRYFEVEPQDIGHVFGFTNTLLVRVKESAREYIVAQAQQQLESAKKVDYLPAIKEAEEYFKSTLEQLDALDRFIDSMVAVLEDYDIATSKLKGLNLDINSSYRKTASNWAFTWEASAEQQAVGAKLATVIGTVKQSKVGGKGIRGLFSSLQLVNQDKLAKDVLQNFVQEFIDKSIAAPSSSNLNLLKQESSPNLLNLIQDGLVEALGGKKKYKSEYTGSISINPIPLLNVKKTGNSSAEKNALRNNKAQIQKQKASIKAQQTKLASLNNKIKANQSLTASLTSLQNLLNSGLVDQIKRNMGTGQRRDVLNLRTGRFAESVRIEKLSESRQGMITAFYSYMKNPYATFSAGGRQEYPKSRDPKLLIAKSIREIVGQQVANRLRAVNI